MSVNTSVTGSVGSFGALLLSRDLRPQQNSRITATAISSNPPMTEEAMIATCSSTVRPLSVSGSVYTIDGVTGENSSGNSGSNTRAIDHTEIRVAP
ncbi:hypothetical protein DQ04_28031000 [Trypanosoma grayi]|uniref:hypothetical protein n=1 Tax=Trypanosoma grayi TaxID=71804 RepID=UPI0004F40BF2|nr:hypothetical protein DQ04_28031000 [Trypanosoma grayi]KEG05096.1 hypothetical protein DQ04_28031000 [Trypanosoma grayi]